MSFVKYKNSNNASSLLIADITASQTTILITDGDQGLFPSSFPFLLTLEHLDASENVILREIVKVVSSNQNSFTVERSAGICVQDDTATNRVQDNTAHAFYSGDKISLYWTAEQVADIQNNLELKANQDSIANVYDSTATYSVGDIVVYQGDRYVCSTAVSTPESFDSTKWTKVNVQHDLEQQDLRIDNIETQISGLSGIMKVDVFVLGGGGGGGGWITNYAGGGGGAGGVQIVKGLPLINKTQNVVVGNGGAGGGQNADGANGGVSKVAGIVALGGGGGGYPNSSIGGHNGGSGGGAGACASGGRAGIGMQGHDGGIGVPAACGWGGPGGGAGGAGMMKTPYSPMPGTSYWQCISIGGHGICTNFGGCVMCIGGGGSGGGISGYSGPMTGVEYGGGGFQSGVPNCFNGKANTGGGGRGGQNNQTGGNGGSGLVIIRYPADCSYGIKTATGGTITTCTIDGLSYKVHTFTSNGTFQITETA